VSPKKELLVASLLAVALAAGIGTISFSLFSEAPPNVRIDVFAEKNGVISVSFLPQDQVFLEAQVSTRNASIAGTPVTFEVKSPNGTDFLSEKVAMDSLGTANVTFQIPWPLIVSPQSTWELGAWKTQVTTEVYGQALNATTDFDCELLQPEIDVYTQKGGYGPNTSGGTFAMGETVHVYAEVRDELNRTVSDWPVSFQSVQLQNGTTSQNGTTWEGLFENVTDSSGIAEISNPIEYGTPATYLVYATASYAGETLSDSMTLAVQP
jgi:hypothetical protein